MLAQQAGGGGAAPRRDPREVVLQRFVVDGRLVAIPAQRGKRLVILDHLAGLFEPGVHYTEAEVNQALPPTMPTSRRCAATWWTRRSWAGPAASTGAPEARSTWRARPSGERQAAAPLNPPWPACRRSRRSAPGCRPASGRTRPRRPRASARPGWRPRR